MDFILWIYFCFSEHKKTMLYGIFTYIYIIVVCLYIWLFKRSLRGTGKMVQLVKSLLHKQEDLSLVSQHPGRS